MILNGETYVLGGDVVTEVYGQPVATLVDLHDEILSHNPVTPSNWRSTATVPATSRSDLGAAGYADRLSPRPPGASPEHLLPLLPGVVRAAP